MKKLLFSLLFATTTFVGLAQTNDETFARQKPIVSAGADLVPVALMDETKRLGFGGSFGSEWVQSTRTSFAVSAGYLLYSVYPGTYGGFSDDMEFIPVSFTLRKFSGKNFYLGPRLGFNIEMAGPQFDDSKSSAVSLFGGLSIGSRSLNKRIKPIFYQHASYGNIVSLQASVRYQLGERK